MKHVQIKNKNKISAQGGKEIMYYIYFEIMKNVRLLLSFIHVHICTFYRIKDYIAFLNINVLNQTDFSQCTICIYT